MLRNILIGAYIVILIFITTIFVDLAAGRDLLVIAAPLLPLFPFFGLRWLKDKEQLAGWAAFTVWLGSTYLITGLPQEFIAFAVILSFALLGHFYSSWFLAPPWFLHIAWDFLPRDLPDAYHQLPLACMIFDSMIGLYLLWYAWQRSPKLKERHV